MANSPSDEEYNYGSNWHKLKLKISIENYDTSDCNLNLIIEHVKF